MAAADSKLEDTVYSHSVLRGVSRGRQSLLGFVKHPCARLGTPACVAKAPRKVPASQAIEDGAHFGTQSSTTRVDWGSTWALDEAASSLPRGLRIFIFGFVFRIEAKPSFSGRSWAVVPSKEAFSQNSRRADRALACGCFLSAFFQRLF